MRHSGDGQSPRHARVRHGLGWKLLLILAGAMALIAAPTVIFHHRAHTHRVGGLGSQDLAPDPAVVHEPGRRYVDVTLTRACGDFGQQVLALYNAAALAHLLNATLAVSTRQQHDFPDGDAGPAAGLAALIDTQHMAHALQPFVRLSWGLPPHLRDSRGLPAPRAKLPPLDPASPQSYLPHALWLREHAVLRTHCSARSMVWSTLDVGRLRQAALRGLAPSNTVAALAKRFRKQVAALVVEPLEPLKYIGLELLHGSEWRTECSGKAGGVQLPPHCVISVDNAASYLEQQRLSTQAAAVFVAGWPMREADAKRLMVGKVVTVASLDLVCTKDRGCKQLPSLHAPPGSGASVHELRGALEWLLLETAASVVGGDFSATTWLLREQRSLAVRSTYYMGLPRASSHGDVTAEEAKHWLVLPGTSLWHLGTPPNAACAQSVVLENVRYWDTGHVMGLGHVTVAPPCAPVPLQVMVDNAPLPIPGPVAGPAPVMANVHDPPSAGARWRFNFSFPSAGLLAGSQQRRDVGVMVCTAGEQRRCSASLPTRISRPLQRHPDPAAAAVVFFYFAKGYVQSSGTEAMHMLHRTINQLHSDGLIDVRSVFPFANEVYRAAHSNFTAALEEFDVTAADYVVYPEDYVEAPAWWPYVYDTTGALPAVYFMGQTAANLHDQLKGKPQYRPLCLTRYFAALHDCSAKAVLNAPLADELVRAADAYLSGNSSKDAMVLLDMDPRGNFDPMQLSLPNGTRLVPLFGLSRPQTLDLYQRAKVLVDSYVTGMERGILEGSLFGVVPVVATSGQAQDMVDVPIPQEWRWEPWDYSALSATITRALERYSHASQAMAPLRQYVRAMNRTFTRQVLDYYSDHVHFMVGAMPLPVALTALPRALDDAAAHSAGAMSLLWLLLAYPFATSEAVAESSDYLLRDASGLFRALQVRMHSRSVATASMQPEYANFPLIPPHYLQPPQHIHYTRYVVLLPSGMLPLARQYVAALLSEARARRLAVLVAGRGVLPSGSTAKQRGWRGGGAPPVLLVDRSGYYPALIEVLPLLPKDSTVVDMLASICAAGGVACGEAQSDDARAVLRGRCAGVHLMGHVPKQCCPHAARVMGHRLWRYALAALQDVDGVRTWAAHAVHVCAHH